jgi:hypothetical protein
MLLTSKKTHTDFEFRAVGYEFPEIEDDEYEANWLLASVRVQSPDGAWEKTEPCLLTWEGHRLANWLADLAAGQGEVEVEMSFLNSNLFFKVLRREAGEVGLSVAFADELAPAAKGLGAGERFEILLVLSVAELRAAAAEWRWEMRLYPMRAAAAGRCRAHGDKRASCGVCGAEVV